MSISMRSQIAAGIARLSTWDDDDPCSAIVLKVDGGTHEQVKNAVGEIATVIGHDTVRVSFLRDEIETAAYMDPWRRRVATAGPNPMAVIFDADGPDHSESLTRVVATALGGGKDVPKATVVVIVRRGEHADAMVEAVVNGVYGANMEGVDEIDVPND